MRAGKAVPEVGARAYPPGSPQRRGGHVDIRIQLAAIIAALSLAVSPAIAAPQHDAYLASPHHWKHHHECSTPKCAHHADLLWAKHHPPKVVAFTGWAIPAPIVECESGFKNDAPNYAGASGYYQIKEWYDKGGRGAPYASEHTKAEQDAIARHLYAEQGTGPWVSSESCWGGRV